MDIANIRDIYNEALYGSGQVSVKVIYGVAIILYINMNIGQNHPCTSFLRIKVYTRKIAQRKQLHQSAIMQVVTLAIMESLEIGKNIANDGFYLIDNILYKVN